MKIKNSLVLNEDFIKAFSDLMLIGMPAKQCLEVSTCMDELATHSQIVIRARKAIVDKYCKKNEDGAPEVEKGDIVFETPELKKECLREVKEIEEEEIDLPLTKRIKIKETEIMTPLKIRVLQDVIDIIE